MLETAALLYDDLIPGGSHWSFIMRRGHVVRLIDETGGANEWRGFVSSLRGYPKAASFTQKKVQQLDRLSSPRQTRRRCGWTRLRSDRDCS